MISVSGWYLDCVTELGVIHGVHALLLCYYGNEAVTPLDLLGDVGGAGLRGDPRRLHDALQDDDHLQVAALQLHRRQVVQRADGTDNSVMDGICKTLLSLPSATL